MQSIHEGITYPCNFCDYNAKQKQRFLVHVDAIYDKVYYSCEACEYKTGFKEVLDGIFYDCDHCDYKASLKTHIKMIHKDVSCTLPQKEFLKQYSKITREIVQ